LKRISAFALSSETSTDATPSSFLIATLTAWAQNAQSIPSTLICTCLSSADAGAGTTISASATNSG
jgi:hypothetical protein